MILPAAEFVYYKRGLFELYGTAAAGVNLSRHKETALTDAGKKAAKKADLSTSFAYQVNPIALRVGNDRIGGFVEAGLGNKGLFDSWCKFEILIIRIDGIMIMRADRKDIFKSRFQEHYSRLCRIAYGYVSDQDDAEDIVQELFISVWNKRLDDMPEKEFCCLYDYFL